MIERIYLFASPRINAILRPFGFTMWGRYEGEVEDGSIHLAGVEFTRNRF